MTATNTVIAIAALAIFIFALCVLAQAIAREIARMFAAAVDQQPTPMPKPKPLPTLSPETLKAAHRIRAGAIKRCKDCRETGCRCQRTCTECKAQA